MRRFATAAATLRFSFSFCFANASSIEEKRNCKREGIRKGQRYGEGAKERRFTRRERECKRETKREEEEESRGGANTFFIRFCFLFSATGAAPCPAQSPAGEELYVYMCQRYIM